MTGGAATKGMVTKSTRAVTKWSVTLPYESIALDYTTGIVAVFLLTKVMPALCVLLLRQDGDNNT